MKRLFKFQLIVFCLFLISSDIVANDYQECIPEINDYLEQKLNDDQCCSEDKKNNATQDIISFSAPSQQVTHNLNFPTECIKSTMLKAPVPSSSLFYGTCDGPNNNDYTKTSKSGKRLPSPCVSEKLVKNIHNKFTAIMTCLKIPLDEIFPIFSVESNFMPNIGNNSGAYGIGQLLSTTINSVESSYRFMNFVCIDEETPFFGCGKLLKNKKFKIKKDDSGLLLTSFSSEDLSRKCHEPNEIVNICQYYKNENLHNFKVASKKTLFSCSSLYGDVIKEHFGKKNECSRTQSIERNLIYSGINYLNMRAESISLLAKNNIKVSGHEAASNNEAIKYLTAYIYNGGDRAMAPVINKMKDESYNTIQEFDKKIKENIPFAFGEGIPFYQKMSKESLRKKMNETSNYIDKVNKRTCKK